MKPALVLNKGETDLNWDIRAIFVTTRKEIRFISLVGLSEVSNRDSRSQFAFIILRSLKNYCFAIKDELNTDVRCDFYLPGNLYRIEIITDGPRDAKAEISEAPSGMTSNLSLKTPRQHRFIFVG